ncbi:MAG: DNA polymerase III subunit gamma/tau [Bacillota bacterium]
MANQALYREYRPRLFGDVIGQSHITRILGNQVAAGRISHAYLLCGTRGTGKTSTAKILARAINCENPEGGEPCGVCSACTCEQSEGVDIIEIDAASNNSVENIRSLLEKVHFTPLHLKTKVYIIDEVHMLSGSAFNALLKTLEEPPEHVVFILATTEPQRLPATIISRCQRFDFHRLSVADIVERMQKVLSDEGASVSPEGLSAIARASDGGMRDALSLLDECLSFCGPNVSADDVARVLGSTGEDLLFDLAGALIGSDAKRTMQLVDRAVREGADLGVLLGDLMMHFRALMLSGVCGDCSDLLDCTDDAMRRYRAQGERISYARSLRALRLLSEAQPKLKWQSQPRVLVESTLLCILMPEQEASIEALEDRVAQLEDRLRGVQAFSFATPVPLETKEAEAPAPQENLMPPESEVSNAAKTPAASAVPSAAPGNANAAEKRVSSAPASSADALWKGFLAALQKENMPLYIMGRCAAGISFNGETLEARFEKESYVNALNKPQNLAVAGRVMESVRPNTALVFLADGERNGVEERARALFGSKLEIVD